MDPARALNQEAAWAIRSIEGDGKPERTAEARMRLMAYRPKIDNDRMNRYQCPRCWVRQGARNPLTPVSGTDEFDMLRCHACGSDFVVPF